MYDFEKYYYEVTHSKNTVFNMGGPIAILKDGKTANAYLSNRWLAPQGTNRNTVLCGEKFTELSEVEIYSLSKI